MSLARFLRLVVPKVLVIVVVIVGLRSPAVAQIVEEFSFNPDDIGGICGLGFSQETATVWVYPCFGSEIYGFTSEGDPTGAIPIAGETSNDVDVSVAAAQLVLGETTVPAGTVLFINGETGPAEIYALDPATGDVLDTLATSFGVSHVVGGAPHPARSTFFLVQDNVPGAADRNRIAEVDFATGDTLRTVFIGDAFNVSYGDLDVSSATGHLFVASSVEASIAEFTPEGDFVQEHALPTGVAGLSGIALDCAANEAWVANTSGFVYRLSQVPCGQPSSVEGEAPVAFRLSTIHPNPFRTEATLVLDVGRAQRVRVAVYDVLGREVEVVYEGIVGAGEQGFTFGGGLSSGLYLVHVAGEGVATAQRVVRLE